MLNKEICKHCILHFFQGRWGSWNHLRERHWEEQGIIYCPKKVDGTESRAYINEDPPSWCYYHLEHIIDAE